MRILGRASLTLALALAGLTLTVVPVGAQVATLQSPRSEPSASPPPDRDQLGAQDALLEYARCMRAEGIEMADPQFDANGTFSGGLGKDASSGVDAKSDGFQLANEACNLILVVTKPALDPELQAEQLERQLAYAGCMRSEGVEMADPGSSGGFGVGSAKLDKAAPEFGAANEVCSELLGGTTGK